MIDQLQKLKESATEKEFKDEPSSYLKLGEWIFTYCIEKTFLKPQKILCISKTDRNVFDKDDIPIEVWQVFGENNFWLCFSRHFEKRGYALMFVSTEIKL